MNVSGMLRLILLFVLGLSSVGCNQSNLAVVKGKVTYKDKPVTSGTITFFAQDKPAAYGDLQPDGTYTLMTDKPGDGATPGKYQVVVVAMKDQANALPEERSPLPAPTVPFKYTNMATTDLTAEVEKGKENIIDFNLTGPLGK